ncbi:ACP S-malonyltransferase [Mycobacterium stomatepiae]|nr:ACP S-malonyltransferase [Mycobacterium stomatepiae]
MGEELIDLYPGLERRADDVLGYSIRRICLEDPNGILSNTLYCQPALFYVNHLTFLHRRRLHGWPDFFAGHSLGEYNALCASGSIDFDTGLELVARRAQLMSEVAQGGMLAVVGLSLLELTDLIEQIGPQIEIANYNLPDQTVVSGDMAQLRALHCEIDRHQKGSSVHLRLSGGFHSRHTQPAAEKFACDLSQADIGDPWVPTVANVTALPYEPGTVRDVLARQMRSPVRWVETMQFLRDQGVDSLTQVGPGRVLDGLWERFIPEPVMAASAALSERMVS